MKKMKPVEVKTEKVPFPPGRGKSDRVRTVKKKDVAPGVLIAKPKKSVTKIAKKFTVIDDCESESDGVEQKKVKSTKKAKIVNKGEIIPITIEVKRNVEINERDSINLKINNVKQLQEQTSRNNQINSDRNIHLFMLMGILDKMSDEEIYSLGEIVDDIWIKEIGIIVNDPLATPKIIQRALFLAQIVHERDLMPLKEIKDLGLLVGKGQYEIILSGPFILDANIIQAIFIEGRVKAIVFSDENNSQFLFVATNGGVKGRILKGNDVFMARINGAWQPLELPEYICSVKIKEQNTLWLFETIRLTTDMKIGCFDEKQKIQTGRFIRKFMIITYY